MDTATVALPIQLFDDFELFAEEMQMPVEKAIRCALRSWLNDCGRARIELAQEKRLRAVRVRRAEARVRYFPLCETAT